MDNNSEFCYYSSIVMNIGLTRFRKSNGESLICRKLFCINMRTTGLYSL